MGIFDNLWKKFIKVQYDSLYWAEVDEVENLRNQLRALKKISSVKSEPKKLGEITVVQLAFLLKPYCSNVNLSDKEYSLTSVAEAKRFSNETKVFARKWIKEEHDCDEFSSALNGYWNDGLKQFAFGIAWSKLHAFNIFVDNNKQIWIVEPQSNKFTKIEDMKNKKYYPLTLILI